MHTDSRLLEERVFADLLASKLSQDAQDRWAKCRSAHRFMAFKGKEVVSYRLLFSEPKIQNIFSCEGLDVGLDVGLSSLWKNQQGEQFWVSHTPVEVAPACFLWHVKRSELAFIPYKNSWSLKFSLAYRTEHNPTAMHDGAFYLLEKAVFDTFQWDSES